MEPPATRPRAELVLYPVLISGSRTRLPSRPAGGINPHEDQGLYVSRSRRHASYIRA